MVCVELHTLQVMGGEPREMKTDESISNCFIPFSLRIRRVWGDAPQQSANWRLTGLQEPTRQYQLAIPLGG